MLSSVPASPEEEGECLRQPDPRGMQSSLSPRWGSSSWESGITREISGALIFEVRQVGHAD